MTFASSVAEGAVRNEKWSCRAPQSGYGYGAHAGHGARWSGLRATAISFTDSGLADYDSEASRLAMERVLEFLDRISRRSA